MKFKGQDFYIPIEWFRSSGPEDSLDKKPQLLVPIPKEYTNLLTEIQNLAIRNGLKLPAEFQMIGNKEEAFKRLPARDMFFIKLNHDVACFNKERQLMKLAALSIGDYRVMIHVKGLYIGSHGNTNKVASLQLRICQIQHAPVMPTCMFSAVLETSAGEKTLQQVQQITEAPKKPARKPKLQRQNAVIEQRIQPMEEQRVETLPSNFFDDIDLSNVVALS